MFDNLLTLIATFGVIALWCIAGALLMLIPPVRRLLDKAFPGGEETP